MVKKYTDNYRLDIAYATIFRNLEPIEEISIHTALNITSGDNLTKKDMVSGTHIVYGGGGETGNTHSGFNVDYKTIGIGRVGARCGCVFEIIPNSWVTDNALMIQSYDQRFSLDFLRHFLSYSDLGQYANNAMQPVISKTRIKDVIIPLIDIQEQIALSKILDSIEKKEKFVSNDYDLLKSKIKIIDNWETLNVEIEIQNDLTAQLKQSILQEAIQGKLTADWREQNPNTEPANELLKRIKAEKAQLIKDNKIKKEKALPPITEEEIPFELPDGWVWCRFVDIAEIARGGSPRPIGNFLTNDKNGINWIKIGDTKNDDKFIYSTREKIKPEGMTKSRYVESGDFLLTNSMSFGRPYIMRTTGCIHDGWLLIRYTKKIIEQDYLYSMLSSKYVYDSFKGSASGGVVQNLNIDKARATIIPIPPISEQKAIIEKIETFMQKCQALEQEIKTSETNAQMLMQAVLKEAFEGS